MAMVKPRVGTTRIRAHMVVADGVEAVIPDINIASNESAYGPGARAVAAAVEAANHLERYADTAQHDLSAAIAEHFGLKPEGVVCGNGSDDLLARIARAYLSPGDELVYSCNGYPKVPNYAFANDAEPVAASDKAFTVDVDAMLAQVTSRTRIVMIANPDNPTGTYISGTEVRRLQAGLPEHVLLVLDSAYLEYVDADNYENPTRLIEEMDNVLMTRTFSKLYGLAGARVGWLYAPAEIAAVIQKVGITFPVPNTAFEASMAVLNDKSHTDFVYIENQRLRKECTQILTELGLFVYPSQTNFIMVEFANAELAEQAYDCLADNGIATRRFASPAFLKCVRFSLGLDEEMQKTLSVMREFMASV